MKRIILVYGTIAGFVIICSMILSLTMSGAEGAGATVWLGYLIMLVSLSLIFFGIKRYRDQELGGVIRFGTAALLGLGISAVAGVIYVAVWEANLARTDYTFIEEYTSQVIEAKQAAGMTGAELQAEVEEMEGLKTRYASPLYRIPMTFLEIFPVGLLVSLLSAAILRRSEVLPARS